MARATKAATKAAAPTHPTFNRAELAKAAEFAARALDPRPSAAALAGILLQPEGDAVAVSATNYDTTARAIVTPGGAPLGESLLVPGRLFADWLNTARGDTVALILDGTRLVCESGGARMGLSTIPAADAPGRPEVVPPAVRVGRDALADALRRVAPAVGTDNLQPDFMACHLLTRDNALEVTATNRYMIARAVAPLAEEVAAGVTFEALPPHKALADLLGRIDGPEVGLALSGGLLHLTGATTSATVRVLEGTFWASLDRILGQEFPGAAVAEVDALGLRAEAQAVGRLATLAGDKHGLLTLTAEAGRVVATMRERTGTTADIAGAPVEWDGPDLEFGINAGYLAAALACVGSARAQITKPAGHKPARFTAPDSDGVAVVMPLH